MKWPSGIASTDPECKYTESALAEKLGVTRQTVNIWIADIRARQKTNRDSIIVRLNRLGWTQEKIAEITGTTQGRVAQIINNANFCEINNLLTQGRFKKESGFNVAGNVWLVQAGSTHMNPQKDNWYGF